MSLLPAAVRSALDALTDGQARNDLFQRSKAITSVYQARQNSRQALKTDADALAYALARMPATFAATSQALAHLLDAFPDYAPESLLDVGCGPGTATFAAIDALPGLSSITLVDRNGPFLELARKLVPTVAGARRISIVGSDLSSPVALPGVGLVIASYVLAELDMVDRRDLLTRLWSAAGSALLLVEPGTPDGFARLREARTTLLADGAHVAAPCTHGANCPMQGADWCRFFVRVQRSRDHMLLKDAVKPYEDEPFAYLALTRTALPSRAAARLIGPPERNKVGISIRVCGADGLQTVSAPSRNKHLFKQFKRLDWGDTVLNPIQEIQPEDEVR